MSKKNSIGVKDYQNKTRCYFYLLHHHPTSSIEITSTMFDCIVFKFLVLGDVSSYFAKGHFDASVKYTKMNIIQMTAFMFHNIFVQLGGQVFQQTITLQMVL